MEKKDIFNWTKALPKEAEWVEIQIREAWWCKNMDFWIGRLLWTKKTRFMGQHQRSESNGLAVPAKPFIKCYMHERTKNATHYGTNAIRIYQITAPQIRLRPSKYDTIKSIRKQQLMAVRSVGRSVGYILHFVCDINCKLITSLHCDFIHIFPVLFNVMQMIKSVNHNWDHFRIDKSNRQSITITKKAHHSIV